MEWLKALVIVLISALCFAGIYAVMPVSAWLDEIRTKRIEREVDNLKERARNLMVKYDDGEEKIMGYVKREWAIAANTATLQVVDNSTSWAEPFRQKKRLYCEYCGCISEKEHGTCEHCGAVLKEMDE